MSLPWRGMDANSLKPTALPVIGTLPGITRTLPCRRHAGSVIRRSTGTKKYGRLFLSPIPATISYRETSRRPKDQAALGSGGLANRVTVPADGAIADDFLGTCQMSSAVGRG